MVKFNLERAFISCFFVCVSIFSYAQDFQWAVGSGSINSASYGKTIDVDAAGNVYSVGYFLNTVDFDPGVGTSFLTSAGNYDGFIRKLDTNGNLDWVKQIRGTSTTLAMSLSLDAAGNIYVVGHFNGTVDFDPGTGVENLTASGFQDVYVLKLDSNGDFIWVKQFGGVSNTETGYAYAVATDNSGNVFCAGEFRGDVSFDFGNVAATLSGNGNGDAFIVKLDTNGNYQWVKNTGNASMSSSEKVLHIATDNTGNVYTTIQFQGTVDFDPGIGESNLVSNGNMDIGLQKLDANGDFIWAMRTGSNAADEAFSVKVDAFGNIYTTGYFTGTADFDPGAGITSLSSAGNTDIFIQKLDTNGDFVWARRTGGVGADTGYDLVTDASGSVYITGTFNNTVDFDPGSNTENLTSSGVGDIFIQKLDANGNFDWAKRVGGFATEIGKSIVLDHSGNLYITGVYNGTVDFDPDAGVSNLTSGNYFVLKLGFTPLPVSLVNFNVKNIGNKTVKITWQTETEINNEYFTLERSKNSIEWTSVINIFGAGNSTEMINYMIQDTQPYSGISYYRLKQTDFDGRFIYSAIQSVNINNLESIRINIYPNPANHQITIKGAMAEVSRIKICNLLGQDVTSYTRLIDKRETGLTIDLTNLLPGTYSIITKTQTLMLYKQ